MTHLTAEHYAELTITLTGTYVKAEADTGTSEGVEDLDIESAIISRKVRENGVSVTREFDILAGLSPDAREIVSQNILFALGTDAVVDALVMER